jgi:DNA-binding NtrC family response regulator
MVNGGCVSENPCSKCLDEMTQFDINKTVLIVDDDSDFLESLSGAIRDYECCNVRTASSSEEALEVLRKDTSVSLIVTDHFMPGMSGTGLLEIAKDLFPNVIRIILSGRASKMVLAGVINRAHAHQYIAKSMPPKLMVKAILRELPGVVV